MPAAPSRHAVAWPVRRRDIDHHSELRIDLAPQDGTAFEDAGRVAREAKALLDDLGYRGVPKTSVRPKPRAVVSAPLDWDELTEVRPEDITS